MSEQKPKPQRAISRRQFFRLSAIAGASAGLAACGGPPPAVVENTPVPAAGATAAPVAEATVAPTTAAAVPTAPAAATAVQATTSTYSEAPMLAELVGAGSLPAIDQRLPKNPVVLDGQDGVGKYGGTVRRAFKGVSDRWGPTKIQNEALTWYNSDFSLRANIAESWETNDDATQWTFRLREGMKWSDGSDFTTDDWKWWYENVVSNTEVTKSPPAVWSAGTPRELMKAEFPDKYTAVFTFVAPRPLFIYTVTRENPYCHAGFMGQFHADFTADKAKLDADAKTAGFDSWDLFFVDKNNWWTLDRPSVGPWIATNGLDQEQFVMERNPYFWQVDSAGNQLPYIDKLTHLLFETPDAFNTRIIAGEIDFQARHVSIGDFTLLKESESQGDYQVVMGVSASHIAFQPNHNAKNPLVKEFFSDRSVRIALSHAINRVEINDLSFNGTAKPRQYSPLEASPQYYEKLSNAYIDYDPEKANQLLDEAGYSNKGSDGIRMWKDGSGPISFVIEGTAQPGSPDEDAVQTMVKYFADVGVKATYKSQERSLYTERYTANELDSAFWGGDRSLLPIVAPWIFTGSMIDRPWAPAWGTFRNDPKSPNAEQPPADHWIVKIWDLEDQMNAEPDDTKRNDTFRQILDIWAEELPMIGIVGQLPSPTIVKNGFKGFKPGVAMDDTTEDENLLNTQTYYWEDPENHSS